MTYEDQASYGSLQPCIPYKYTQTHTRTHCLCLSHTYTRTFTHTHTHTHTHTPGTWRQRIWMFEKRETSGRWSNFSKVSSTLIFPITFSSELTYVNFYPVHSAVPC